uniref:class F sortase n=1 Tax=Pseudonocardia sp. CA-138482 TaxID=3240023 RepID=UPI003F493F78
MTWKAALTGGFSVAALVLIGVAIVGGPAPAPDTPATAAAPAPSPIAPTPTPRALGPVPTSVSIQKIAVRSSLIPLYLNPDGTVQVPDVHTPQQAGWYALDARPGDPGAAVLLGHVDGDGSLGVFHDIGRLVGGDQIQVSRIDGTTVTFTVTKVQTISKAAFPSDAVYLPTPDAELRLVTCGGPFDPKAKSYIDSVIVYAKKV